MLLVVPLRPGDCPSFYRPRRRQFTSVPHCSSYVWRYGAQYNGVDDRPGESGFRRSIMSCPVSAQERLRGWRRSSLRLDGLLIVVWAPTTSHPVRKSCICIREKIVGDMPKSPSSQYVLKAKRILIQEGLGLLMGL
jgi:hypothetical protein